MTIQTDYTQRTFAGFTHEQSLPGKLRARGWHVNAMGMGILPDAMQLQLQRYRDSYNRPCLLRWFPDFVATTDRFGKIKAYLVDAKATMREDTGNYAIEANAFDAYQVVEQDFHIPVLLLGEDDRVLTMYAVKNRGVAKQDGRKAGGSKTAFFLVHNFFAEPMNRFFGEPMG